MHGTLGLNLNAFSGEEPFSPVRAESQGPVPVWVWVMCALVAAWALWYGLEFFKIPPEFANTPTYASNPALAAANEPAAGTHTQMAPRFTGKGAVPALILSRLARRHLQPTVSRAMVPMDRVWLAYSRL